MENYFENYIEVIKNWNDFKTKTPKGKFQKFILLTIGIQLLLAVISVFIFDSLLIMNIYSIAILVPSVSLIVRRLRDIGRSWFWVLLFLVPYIQLPALLYLSVKDSKSEDEKK